MNFRMGSTRMIDKLLHSGNEPGAQITVKADRIDLEGHLRIPQGAEGIVVFAHGSGSSRLSPRNKYVADVLNDAGIGTLLFDLLTSEEETVDASTARLRFDIEFLADRLVKVTKWLSSQPATAGLPIGYFGASTGAAAALVAAAELPDLVAAIVSRGGRPDLARDALALVRAPTLLIVGERDPVVLDLNEQALARLTSAQEKSLVVVPRATHLFEEKGTLPIVAQTASKWFAKYLRQNILENGSSLIHSAETTGKGKRNV